MENETRIRKAGLRMAMKLIPPELLNAAPQHLEQFLRERLAQVEPEGNEVGSCFLIVPKPDNTLSVMTVTLDEQNTVCRIVSETTIAEIFGAILNNMKEL